MGKRRPCNCGRPAGLAGLAHAKSASKTAYPLGKYPECTDLYPAYGPSAGTGIYLIGRGTDEEKMFARNKLAEASAYATEVSPSRTLEIAATTALCKDAVIDVYGR